MNGVTVAGTKYMYLSSTDKVARAKKGTSGVHVIKTTQSNQLSFFYNFTLEFELCPFSQTLDFILLFPRIVTHAR